MEHHQDGVDHAPLPPLIKKKTKPHFIIEESQRICGKCSLEKPKAQFLNKEYNKVLPEIPVCKNCFYHKLDSVGISYEENEAFLTNVNKLLGDRKKLKRYFTGGRESWRHKKEDKEGLE